MLLELRENQTCHGKPAKFHGPRYAILHTDLRIDTDYRAKFIELPGKSSFLIGAVIEHVKILNIPSAIQLNLAFQIWRRFAPLDALPPFSSFGKSKSLSALYCIKTSASAKKLWPYSIRFYYFSACFYFCFCGVKLDNFYYAYSCQMRNLFFALYAKALVAS